MKTPFNHPIRTGIITGILLCIWIFIEYLTGVFFNKTELGALYGLLSEVILVWAILQVLDNEKMGLRYQFKQAMKMVIVAASIVLPFMFIYIFLINTKLYGLTDQVLENYSNYTLYGVIFGTFVGVILEGLIMTLLIIGIKKGIKFLSTFTQETHYLDQSK